MFHIFKKLSRYRGSIKNNKIKLLEIKTTMCKDKNILDRINIRLYKKEEKIVNFRNI